MSAWPDWLKVIQLKPRFLFGLWLCGALILFLPDTAANALGMHIIRQTYRGWIGLGTLAAFSFWLVQLIPLYHGKRRAKKIRAQIIGSLNSLSPEEWLLIAYCLERNQQTLTLEITHRAAGALSAKGIFVRSAGIGNQLAWPYTIPDFLWHYLTANRHVIFNGIEPSDPQLQAKFEEIEGHIRRHDYFL